MDDGFVEIVPESSKAVSSPLIISTLVMRSAERLSLSFQEEVFARLGGGPRVRADWSAKSWTIRLRADDAGRFEARRAVKGSRVLLWLPLSPGLVARPKTKEPCPHRWDGQTLFAIVPPVFRGVDATPRQAPRDGAPAGEAEKQRAAIEAARNAVPAPSFSGPGRRKS